MTDLTRSASRLTARTVAKRGWKYVRAGGLWDVYFISALPLGLLLQAIFDGVVDERSLGHLALLISVYALVEVVRRVIVHRAAISWAGVWTMLEMLPRGGMLRGQLSSGGRHAGTPIPHAGAAMARFRDDPKAVSWYADSWMDVVGAGAFTIVAVIIMASINPWLTVFCVLPVFAVAGTTRLLGHWVARAHRNHLEATSRLTESLRDVLAAHDTIRLYDARESTVGEVARRSAERSRAAVVDRILTESIRAASNSLSGVAVGVMLLVAAGDLRNGEMSIGDLALFTAYLRWMTFLPRMMGHFITRHRQAEVAFDRMGELAADSEPANLLEDFDLDIDRAPDPTPAAVLRRTPLDTLSVRNLASTYPNGAGIRAASFTIRPGTLTVVTGPVGAGKTTLVRALLGLLPSTGLVTWNGGHIDDLGEFMVPPQAAYLPQAPKLLSASLADNVELGACEWGVEESVAMAGLATEVASMAAGTATLVGPRGVRLSGGQRQRLGLARALHRRPELLVLDDLSSALDADTEVALWQELRDSGQTILAISNRPIAIQAADQVLSVTDGELSLVN